MNRGFTLVETLVALVVLAVGLLALAKMNVTYVRATTFSHSLSEATVLAEAKMEELRSYANSERSDQYSVFDFDYLTSTTPCHTTILDPPASTNEYLISGLLSGGVTDACGPGGTNVTGTLFETTGGTRYEVLTDNGSGVYEGTDTIDFTADDTGTGANFTVDRRWSVEPIDVDADTIPDYAALVVESSYTDRFGQTRTITLESLVHRRQ